MQSASLMTNVAPLNLKSKKHANIGAGFYTQSTADRTTFTEWYLPVIRRQKRYALI